MTRSSDLPLLPLPLQPIALPAETPPSDVVGAAGRGIDVVLLVPEQMPPAPTGFQVGDHGFRIAPSALSDNAMAPLVLSYKPSTAELVRADGDLARVHVALWQNGAWLALPCDADAAAGTLTCNVAWQAGQLVVLVAPPAVGPLDADLPNGHFFKQTNGFGGAGEAGFAVVDDDDARLWTEFQRFGGVERVGYPISARFVQGGYVTQAFQKLALQWRPDLQQAIVVTVLDDLSRRGSDDWLDRVRDVPPAVTAGDDPAALTWDELVARQLELLRAYPAVQDFYAADPAAVDFYGLPVAVKSYGSFVTVRFQRATLRLWTVDVPWAPAGTIVVGNSGDLAKEAGLWSPDVLTPRPSSGPLASKPSDPDR